MLSFVKNCSPNVKIKALQILHHIGFLFGIVWGGLNWWFFGFCSYVLIETLGGNVGLHRLFAHKSYCTGRVREWILCFLSNILGVGSTISWSAAHRYHHKYSDTKRDCHSPHNSSYTDIILGRWKLSISPKLISDLSNDPMHRFFHKYYYSIHFFWVVALVFINPYLVIFLYCVPAVGALHVGHVLAIWNHKVGYRTYETEDRSRNSFLASIVSFGEGWHNNHHNNPRKWKTGEQWWEFDLPALVIKLFFLKKEPTI